MANTYSQIYIQIVFAVKNRDAAIHSSWEQDLYKYITGIVQKKQQKMLSINGTSNHIHLLIGMEPNCCLSDLVREIKKSTNEFIKEKRYCRSAFYWQEGFGAFSYGRSQINDVCSYIMNQKEHHKQHSFREEYLSFLKKFEIEYDEKYLFEWIDES